MQVQYEPSFEKVVVVMRAQLFHLGHLELLKRAIQIGKDIFIFIGSANSPRTLDNPFTFAERKEMVENVLHYEFCGKVDLNKVKIFPLNDILDDNDAWLKQITDIVGPGEFEVGPFGPRFHKTAVIGGAKREWYIPLFSKCDYDHVQIEPFKAPAIEDGKGTSMGQLAELNATDLRKAYFMKFYDDANVILKKLVPESVFKWLKNYRYNTFYGYMASAFCTKRDLNAKYGTGPFLTCDNIIECKGKILLVKRKNHPGKGLWAIPGGYLDPQETLENGAYRELQEETKASISIDQFREYCVATKIFDAPRRSLVCRIITSAYHVVLPEFPTVEAADDAAETGWFTLQEIKAMHHLMHDDHWYIIKYFTNFGEPK